MKSVETAVLVLSLILGVWAGRVIVNKLEN